LNQLIKNFICGVVVLLLLLGCSASSSSQRFKQPKSDRNSKPSGRFESPETNKNPAQNVPSERIVFNDLPPDTTDEFDEIPVEDSPVDNSKFVEHIEKLKDFNVALTMREKVLLEVIKYLETPYKYGGNTQKGIDCSAFTLQVYKNSFAFELPRSTSQQYKIGDSIDKDELKFGDLVFFNTRKKSFPGHVGIYLGENKFAHASRSFGVTISSLESSYYKKRYVGARRIENIEN
jgi:cell wall-associated NlpC family hydrolase